MRVKLWGGDYRVANVGPFPLESKKLFCSAWGTFVAELISQGRWRTKQMISSDEGSPAAEHCWASNKLRILFQEIFFTRMCQKNSSSSYRQNINIVKINYLHNFFFDVI